MCEVVLCQVNYLIDEVVVCGRGVNVMISYVYYYFMCYGFGEIDVYLYVDNCVG